MDDEIKCVIYHNRVKHRYTSLKWAPFFLTLATHPDYIHLLAGEIASLLNPESWFIDEYFGPRKSPGEWS